MEDYIETIGAKDYFSVAYEQWQNGLAESSIGLLMLLTRSQMAESGMGGRFWFRAWYWARMLVMQSITTGLEQLLITLCLRNPRMFPSSELSDARRSCT